jgi:hypothetical protein
MSIPVVVIDIESFYRYRTFAIAPATNQVLSETYFGDGLAQSIYCLTPDWEIVVRSTAKTRDLSSSLCVQTDSEAHPASYPMDTGGPFLGVKRPMIVADHSPHLVPRSRMSRSYNPPPPTPSWCVVGQL